MTLDWTSEEDRMDEKSPLEEALSEAERAAVERELGWCTMWEVVRRVPGRKLVRAVTPQTEEELYHTLVSDPVPRLLFHEPVTFVVTVQEAKGTDCRAGHKVGDCWEFSWCTPEGMCGAAYHAMYPVLHGLMLSSGRYEGPAAEETEVACPDKGWLTFRIQRRRWMPDMWETDDDLGRNP
jgi:uncharacterized repeat protein (TIGR04076 family)